jgi:phosphatidate cytidylyltransferase
MVYRNLFYRLLFSLFFILIFFVAFNNKYLLFFLGTLIYLFIFYEIIKFFKKFSKLILIYIFSSYFFFVLYFFNFFDYLIFNIFVFTIIFFDSFSYLNGKLFGKNYIFKFISPKKTLEGYLGGLFFTNAFFIFYFYYIQLDLEFIKFITLLNLIIFISIIGDLIESYFKRINNIKDSSKYLPGHGGYFDRFDSFIASIIMLTVFSFISNI